MSESDDGGEGNENENEEEDEEEEEFPICFYTECKDAPWSPLTERLARSAEEAKASLLLSVDEAEATFYAWATLAEKRGFFGSHACFAHDDCISGCEGKSRIKKDRQRRRKWTTRKQQEQHRQCNRTPDESTEDERERNAPLSEVVFEWKPSLEDNRNDDTDGELERLNDINNERITTSRSTRQREFLSAATVSHSVQTYRRWRYQQFAKTILRGRSFASGTVRERSFMVVRSMRERYHCRCRR